MVAGLRKLLSDRTLSPGLKVDELLRRAQVKMWRGSSHRTVELGNRRVDFVLRPGSTDAEVLWQSFIGNQYEVPVVPGVRPVHRQRTQSTYERMVTSGSTPLIVDCGANIGASAVWFKLKYPASAVIAVEPAPENCMMLRQNLVSFTDVKVIEAGIGSTDRTSFLQDAGHGNWGFKTGDEPSVTQIAIVSMETVVADHVKPKFEPFILKIDIEGAEDELFSGSWDTMNRFPLIVIEPHDFCMAGKHTSASFFKFHAAMNREFLFHYENVFSFRTDFISAPV